MTGKQLYKSLFNSGKVLHNVQYQDRANLENELKIIDRFLLNYPAKHTDVLFQTETYKTNKEQYDWAVTTTKNLLSEMGHSDYWPSISTEIYVRRYLINSYFSSHDNLVRIPLQEYKTALIQESIEVAEEMLKSLNTDPMMRLHELAKEQGRLVYAIAWAILLFQIFAILFMYYKRVIVILLLVILFPVVMAMYVIDKLGDGQAQSLQNWFKEFMVNCTIQFLHAIVYLLVVNVGIDICNLNPSKNWLFLIIAVTALFPIERMVRQIVGLNSSTVGSLKNNIAGMALAGAALLKTGKNLGRMGANAAKAGGDFASDIASQHAQGKSFKSIAADKAKKAAEATKKKLKQPAEEVNAKRARKSQLRQSRSDNRNYRMNAAKDARSAINAGVGTFKDRVDIARGAVANVTAKASNAMNKVRNSKIGKIGMGAATVGAYAGKTLKMTAGGAKKVFGTAAGVIQGMESAADAAVDGRGPFSAGITSGRAAIHSYAGFKDQKPYEAPQQPTNVPSNYSNNYSSRNAAVGAAAGAAAVIGASAVSGYGDSDPVEEPRESENNNSSAQTTPPPDGRVEAEVKQNTDRNIDSSGNVTSSTTTTDSTVRMDNPGAEDVKVNTNTTFSESGSVRTETELSTKPSTDGTSTVSTDTKTDDGETKTDDKV